MTTELRKAIRDRSWLQNKYLKYLSRENFVNMTKICRKYKIKYLKRSTELHSFNCTEKYSSGTLLNCFLKIKVVWAMILSLRNGDAFTLPFLIVEGESNFVFWKKSWFQFITPPQN